MENRNPKMTFEEKREIFNDIILYGKDILNSEVFRGTLSQTHHLRGTVFEHTINVCVVSLRLCYQLTERGIPVNKRDLIRAALCHDLGMVDRDTKYKDRIDSWRSHPKESAQIARRIFPDLSAEAEDMILSHMWPVAGQPPRTNEGMLLCMADKYASMAEWKNWLSESKYAARILEQLDGLRRV